MTVWLGVFVVIVCRLRQVQQNTSRKTQAKAHTAGSTQTSAAPKKAAYFCPHNTQFGTLRFKAPGPTKRSGAERSTPQGQVQVQVVAQSPSPSQSQSQSEYLLDKPSLICSFPFRSCVAARMIFSFNYAVCSAREARKIKRSHDKHLTQ